MYLWRNGEFIRLDKPEVKISPRTHGLHYSTCIIEGIPGYYTILDGLGGHIIFRLDDHLKRLFHGIKALGLEPPKLTLQEVKKGIIEIVQTNGEKEKNIYIRPFAYNPAIALGVGSSEETVIEIVTREMTPYLGPETAEKGATLWYPAPGFSSQPCRLDPILSRIKWAGNYGRTFFWKKGAPKYGCHEIIVEGPNGYISETAGSCLIFVDENRNFLTPADDTLPLPSITLATGIYLLEKLGVKVEPAHLTYDDLIFGRIRIKACTLFGSWTEVTQVEKIKVGIPPAERFSFSYDPVLKKVEELYKEMVIGKKIEFPFPTEEWLTFIE